MKRQTQKERSQLKTDLSSNFDRWNKMTDEELKVLVIQRAPALVGPIDRGFMLKFLTMDFLDKII